MTIGPLRGETNVLTDLIRAFLECRAPARRRPIPGAQADLPCRQRMARDAAAIQQGFTLIELLIVVAIISILASIAVPNFLEAQTRARVAAMRNDMRVLATGLESYRVDRNSYPSRTTYPTGSVLSRAADSNIRAYEMGQITSPIAYLTSLPRDLFETGLAPPNNRIDYWPYSISEPLFASIPVILNGIRSRGGEWTLMSVGPDGTVGFSPGAMWGHFPPTPTQFGMSYRDEYDPSNGTISGGNLYRFQSGRDGTEVYQGQ